MAKIRQPAHPSRPGAKSPKGGTTSTPKPKIFAPVPAWGTHGRIGGRFGDQRPGHIHHGLDVDVPIGSACVAPTDGVIGKFAVTSNFAIGEGPHGGGGMIHFIFNNSVGSIKAGTVIGWGHVFQCFVKPGQKVKAGQVVGKSGGTNGGPHVHFIQRQDEGGEDGSVDPQPLFLELQKGSVGTGSPGGGGPTTTSTSTTTNVGTSAAGAFSTFLELPGIFDQARSEMLAGKKSLMNDQPLLPFVEQLCKASLRNFQSMPNGNFFAFFPDYFGGLSHRTAYWNIEDIEILDGQIELSDDALATHVYIVGDTSPSFGTIDITDEIMTSGVVTIFDAFSSDFITGLSASAIPADSTGGATGATQGLFEGIAKITDKANALAFLTKYGARPYREEAPMVRNSFFELFLAYQTFMLMWSQQFLTTFTFTFMPELYPGGIVAFPDHGIQCYIAEVAHTFDYEVGFTTQANLMAPAALAPTSDKKNVHDGLVRAFTLGNDLPFDPFTSQGKSAGDKAATGTRPSGAGGN